MAYSASKIECLRFAAEKGGEGIGCCAIDLFQGFVNDPDAKAAVRLNHGDSGSPLTIYKDGKCVEAWLGPTNRDIFLQYLRIGTFDTQEMPNRMFLAAMTDEQMESSYGQEWMRILKEQGFQFIAKVDNSVYSGQDVGEPSTEEPSYCDCGCGMSMGDEPAHPVYLFGLFRNIGTTRVDDPFKAPQFWEDLPTPTKTDMDRWLEGETKILTKEEATGTTIKAEQPAAKSPW